MSLPAGIVIRNYEPRDREDVRRLCCETGFLGKPIDPVFEDRELFADYLTSYYTDHEPESSFVIVHDGVIKGYLLGSRKPFKQQWRGFLLNFSLFTRAAKRYWGYSRTSRDFIGWILRNSWREVPAAPRRTAHFHINCLPEARSLACAREVINRYMEYLRAAGEKAVFGQMVTFEGRRGAPVFERYGFRVFNKQEITKYRKLHPEPVYLTTIIKNLDSDDEARPMQTVVHS
ncbi:MAG: GNAT family acetyltransferase [Chthoniobacterales bacterium]